MGPGIIGSPDVLVNKRPALRVGDQGVHAACCGGNMWTAAKGSATVMINGKAAHRMTDATTHCGGSGQLIEGSPDVIVGDGGGGGGGSGGSGSPGSSSSSGGGSGTKAQQQTQQQSPAPAPATQPAPSTKPAIAQWKIAYNDNKPVDGVSAHYEGPTGPKDLDGANNQVSGLVENDEYTLTLTGKVTVKGTVKDDDGKPVAGAKLHLERALGDDVDLETDGSGQFTAEGFVKDEPFEVTILSTTTVAKIKLVDDDGKPVVGKHVRIITDGGLELSLTSDGGGEVKAEGLVPGEGYMIEVE